MAKPSGVNCYGASNAFVYTNGVLRACWSCRPKPYADIVSWKTQTSGLRPHDFFKIPKNERRPFGRRSFVFIKLGQQSIHTGSCKVIKERFPGFLRQGFLLLRFRSHFIESMVDDGKIALTPAVELSYLTKLDQRDLMETMESEDCTPSLSQAIQLKRLSQAGELDIDRIFDILREPKANQIDKISFHTADLRKFFPKSYSPVQMQDVILRLLEGYQRQRREQNRDSR